MLFLVGKTVMKCLQQYFSFHTLEGSYYIIPLVIRLSSSRLKIKENNTDMDICRQVKRQGFYIIMSNFLTFFSISNEFVFKQICYIFLFATCYKSWHKNETCKLYV